MLLGVTIVFANASAQVEIEPKQCLTLAHRKIQIKTILILSFTKQILNFLASTGYNPYNVYGLCHKVPMTYASLSS